MEANWIRCESVRPGGKPHFYIQKVAEYGPENWGFKRIIWNRDVRAWAATVDQKYGGRPQLVGYFSTPEQAAEHHEARQKAGA